MLTYTVKCYRALAIALSLAFRKGNWVNTVSGQNEQRETKSLGVRCLWGKGWWGEVTGIVYMIYDYLFSSQKGSQQENAQKSWLVQKFHKKIKDALTRYLLSTMRVSSLYQDHWQEKYNCKDNGSSEGNVIYCALKDTSKNAIGQRYTRHWGWTWKTWKMEVREAIPASIPKQTGGKQGRNRTGGGSRYFNEINSEKSKD